HHTLCAAPVKATPPWARADPTIVPEIATPRAVPVCRPAEASDAATPAIEAGIPETAGLVIGGVGVATRGAARGESPRAARGVGGGGGGGGRAPTHNHPPPPGASAARGTPGGGGGRRARPARPARGDTPTIIPPPGSRHSPAVSAGRPRTSCRYRVVTNKNAP